MRAFHKARHRKVHQPSKNFSMTARRKKRADLFVRGQTPAGIVTKMIDDDAIGVWNQTSNRIIIRLDRIDAVTAN